jgi:hypothetical protein
LVNVIIVFVIKEETNNFKNTNIDGVATLFYDDNECILGQECCGGFKNKYNIFGGGIKQKNIQKIIVIYLKHFESFLKNVNCIDI